MYTVDPMTFTRHVGTYDDPFNVGPMIIADAGGTLTISMPDLDALGYDIDPDLQAISSEIFIMTIDGQPLDLTFIPAAPGGDSVYVRNRSFVTSRAIAVPAAAPSAFTADRATIDRLLAQARLDPTLRRIWRAKNARGKN
jgi:hypothetical protein